MATYYGYADRDASSQVNWAEVGKNMTDMLQEQIRIRDAKKAEIDKASREFGETLANAPQGQNDGLNGFAMTHANEASKFRLMQDRLLKQGLLDVRAYTIGRQNVVDGTKKAFDMAKNLQAIYAEKRDKYDKGELSEADLQLMANIEGFGKLDDTRTYINPTNGTVSVAKMVKDANGVITMTENPNGYLSINEIGNFMQKDIGKFKLDAALEAQVKRTGAEVKSFMNDPGIQRTGSITSISDPTTKANFDKYVKGIISAETVNEFHNMSTLMDYVGVNPKTGNAWQISFDPKDKSNPDIVYLKKDGQGWFTPELNADQKTLVKNYLKTRYIGMLDREVKQQSIGEISQTTAVTIGEQDQKQRSDTFGELMGLLVSGTPQQKRDAAQSLNAMQNAKGESIGNRVEVNDNGDVFFTNAEGRIDPFNIKGLTKERAGMTMYTMYGEPFALDKEQFKRAMMNAGSKKTTIYKGTQVRAQAGQKKAATDNTGTGATGGKTVFDVLNTGK